MCRGELSSTRKADLSKTRSTSTSKKESSSAPANSTPSKPPAKKVKLASANEGEEVKTVAPNKMETSADNEGEEKEKEEAEVEGSNEVRAGSPDWDLLGERVVPFEPDRPVMVVDKGEMKEVDLLQETTELWRSRPEFDGLDRTGGYFHPQA